jgi:hypothetical protein
LKFGYYISDKGKSVWKDGKDRNMMEVFTIDSEGTPSGEPKQVKKSPESDKDAYNVFRYNNIEIVYESVEKGTTEEPTEVVEKVVDLAYPVKIRIPARYRSKRIKIPLPYISIGAKFVAGKGSKPTACPDFSSGGGGGGVKTKFGIGIRQVTIASWKSDLTK